MNASKTKIIAHRGFSSQYPENTMLAFQKAIGIGADFIELDLHKTKDDVIVVIHDDSVNRTSSNERKGEISEMTYDQLSDINVGYTTKFGGQFSDQKIPSLREVLELAKGKIKVCIEIKVAGIEQQILQLVHEVSMNDQVILFCFDQTVLTKIRKLDAKIPLLYLVEKIELSNIEEASKENFNAVGGGSATIITKELVDIAHSKNIEIWRWTVDNETEILDLLYLGIDGLITNAPDLALEKRKLYLM